MTENEEQAPEITEEIEGYITNVVAAYVRDYTLVDARDLRQHIYLMWLEKTEKVRERLAEKDEEIRIIKLVRLMSGWAADYCRGETAAIRGYRPEDVYHYSRPQLRELLPLLAYPSAWTSLAAKGDDGSRQCGAPLAECGDALAVLADLSAGFANLNDRDHDLLCMRFIETGIGKPKTPEEKEIVHVVYEEIREYYGFKTPAAARSKVAKAVTRLLTLMGGPRAKDVNPRRHSMSNAAAQVQTRQDWTGS